MYTYQICCTIKKKEKRIMALSGWSSFMTGDAKFTDVFLRVIRNFGDKISVPEM